MKRFLPFASSCFCLLFVTCLFSNMPPKKTNKKAIPENNEPEQEWFRNPFHEIIRQWYNAPFNMTPKAIAAKLHEKYQTDRTLWNAKKVSNVLTLLKKKKHTLSPVNEHSPGGIEATEHSSPKNLETCSFLFFSFCLLFLASFWCFLMFFDVFF